MEDPRTELERLWDEGWAEHKTSSSLAWGVLEDRFGEPAELDLVHRLPEADRLRRDWGTADPWSYPSLVAGHITTILDTADPVPRSWAMLAPMCV